MGRGGNQGREGGMLYRRGRRKMRENR